MVVEQTRRWIIALTDFVLTALAMIIVNAKDGVLSKLYAGNQRYDHVSGAILYQLPVKNLDNLLYFDLYTFATRIWTNRIFDAVRVQRCRKINWGNTSTMDGFLCHDFTGKELHGLKEESVHFSNRACGRNGSFTTWK